MCAVDSAGQTGRQKGLKLCTESEDATVQVPLDWTCTGEEQSVVDESAFKNTSSQTDPVLLPADESYIHKNQKLSARVVSLEEEMESL